jgi:hypothetical protein
MQRFEGKRFWIERGRQIREHDDEIKKIEKSASATRSGEQATLILEMEKKAIATLAHQYLPAAYLSMFSNQCKLGPQRLLQEDTPESITLAACILLDRNRTSAYHLFEQAARRGSAYAAYLCGAILLEADERQKAMKAIDFLFFAANKGCVGACRLIAFHPTVFDLRALGLHFLRYRLTKSDKISNYMYSLHSSPLGFWIPDDALQTIVAPEITAAQRTWMLVAKRMHVPHGVAIIVVGYICSAPYETR